MVDPCQGRTPFDVDHEPARDQVAGLGQRAVGVTSAASGPPYRTQVRAGELAAIDALDTGVRGGPDPASISPATYPYKVEND